MGVGSGRTGHGAPPPSPSRPRCSRARPRGAVMGLVDGVDRPAAATFLAACLRSLRSGEAAA